MHQFAPGFHYLVILSRSAAEAKNPVLAFQERDSSAFGLRMTNTILGMNLRIGVLNEGVTTGKHTALKERLGGHWKAEPEMAAPAYLTLDPHLTTVSLDQVPGDSQPQARSAPLAGT